jgi:type IV secretion system protein VirB10
MTDQPHDSSIDNPGGENPTDTAFPAAELQCADPVGMQLRPERAMVTRLSRRILVGLCAVIAGGAFTALAFALWPHQAKAPTLSAPISAETLPDRLNNLPKDYSQLTQSVPKLGPPLPGDLGRPLLKAGVAAPGLPAPQTPDQQRIVQAQDAARTSKLFAITSSVHATTTSAPVSANTSLPSVAQPAADPTEIQNMQAGKLTFANSVPENQTVSAARFQRPTSPYTIQAGWIIPGALSKGIKSDLPGDIRAQVTQNVYDSLTGRILLVPQGSTLIGRYNSQVSYGQTRVQMIWSRLILPNGRSIVLQNLPGEDVQGYTGLEDDADEHWGAIFKAAILSTVLSVGAEAGTSNNENNLAQAIRQGASQSVNQTGEQIVARNLNIQPTLTERFGLPVIITVTQDLVLEPYAQEASP